MWLEEEQAEKHDKLLIPAIAAHILCCNSCCHLFSSQPQAPSHASPLPHDPPAPLDAFVCPLPASDVPPPVAFQHRCHPALILLLRVHRASASRDDQISPPLRHSDACSKLVDRDDHRGPPSGAKPSPRRLSSTSPRTACHPPRALSRNDTSSSLPFLVFNIARRRRSRMLEDTSFGHVILWLLRDEQIHKLHPPTHGQARFSQGQLLSFLCKACPVDASCWINGHAASGHLRLSRKKIEMLTTSRRPRTMMTTTRSAHTYASSSHAPRASTLTLSFIQSLDVPPSQLPCRSLQRAHEDGERDLRKPDSSSVARSGGRGGTTCLPSFRQLCGH